jgi:hypothetical protein
MERRNKLELNCNPVSEFNHLAAIVTAVWSSHCVNLQVFLDGDCSFWVTSVHEGSGPGFWHEPERVE